LALVQWPIPFPSPFDPFSHFAERFSVFYLTLPYPALPLSLKASVLSPPFGNPARLVLPKRLDFFERLPYNRASSPWFSRVAAGFGLASPLQISNLRRRASSVPSDRACERVT